MFGKLSTTTAPIGTYRFSMNKKYQIQPGPSIELTNFGFVWGAATVSRVCSLPNDGVVLRIETPTSALNLRITKGGKIVATNDAKAEAKFVAPSLPTLMDLY